METSDLIELAESLKDMASSLQMFIDVQAEALAEPQIAAAGLRATEARKQQESDRASFEQWRDDLRREFQRQIDALEKTNRRLAGEAKAAQATIRRVQAVQTWTDEDRKRFVFADELWAALKEGGE